MVLHIPHSKAQVPAELPEMDSRVRDYVPEDSLPVGGGSTPLGYVRPVGGRCETRGYRPAGPGSGY